MEGESIVVMVLVHHPIKIALNEVYSYKSESKLNRFRSTNNCARSLSGEHSEPEPQFRAREREREIQFKSSFVQNN